MSLKDDLERGESYTCEIDLRWKDNIIWINFSTKSTHIEYTVDDIDYRFNEYKSPDWYLQPDWKNTVSETIYKNSELWVSATYSVLQAEELEKKFQPIYEDVLRKVNVALIDWANCIPIN